jgi:small multidrug resistance pump
MQLRPWMFLAVAIIAEVISTTALKATAGFTRLGPSLVVVAGYATAFYCLSRTLDVIPVGIGYALWSGIGIVVVTALAWVLYGQVLDLPAIVGLALIVAGVLVLNLFSQSVVMH